MDAGLTSARHARAQPRHDLLTLTYVTLDQANGGIVRNLTSTGMGLQVVAAVRPKQQLRVRFELRYPRLQVETRAEVVWATFSGQCGMRFLDMPPALRQQINQWIFGNLLERISVHEEHSQSIFAAPPLGSVSNGNRKNDQDGLLVSATPVKVIELPPRRETAVASVIEEERFPVSPPVSTGTSTDGHWLSQPLSGRALAWTVDVLVVVASVLLFTVVFLSIAGEAPPWPFATAAGAVLAIAGMYHLFFSLCVGGRLGAKLAQIADVQGDGGEDSPFR